MTKYSDVFAMCDAKLGCTDLVEHSNDTSDHGAIRQQPYWVYHDRIDQMIVQMKEQGIVRPSVSPWASLIVLVPKKNGEFRFCVDYRCLNFPTREHV